MKSDLGGGCSIDFKSDLNKIRPWLLLPASDEIGVKSGGADRFREKKRDGGIRRRRKGAAMVADGDFQRGGYMGSGSHKEWDGKRGLLMWWRSGTDEMKQQHAFAPELEWRQKKMYQWVENEAGREGDTTPYTLRVTL
ncbi:hypothetical protein L1987_22672 [Smallanthus sonchifolius]|uniref:Uncharacterized protein n=1 Tax=Smallanthus sonchifolius TaxID=185202 RepID=A0ACB9IGF3_9ASTR|nr:hypothetical protein L1987_22672 [Smallanthus sonchifolius]